MQLTLQPSAPMQRPLAGVGLQCDAYLYDHVNAAAGVTEADCALVERRLRALRPSLARTFCHMDWFNPARDAATYRWDLPGYAHLVRLLRVLQELGTRVNLVLFAPMWGQSMAVHRTSVRAMGDLLAHLRGTEGLDVVRWLTIFNEPETVFPHDSPLMRRIFGDARVDGLTNWTGLVELWRLAQERLEALALYPAIKLAVPDCVYGSPVRYERLRLAAQEFATGDVSFAVHCYSPEDQSGQPQTVEQQRDWGYPGMAREAADFRALVGPDREMILWEYNLEGLGGRTPLFPGVNRWGVPVMETLDTGPEVLEKSLLALQHGYDGVCLWCLSDLRYCEDPGADMQVGLWRYKQARWYPRPHYYYYAPLCQLFRGGMQRLPVVGAVTPVFALAAAGPAATVAVLLNRGTAPQALRLAGLPSGTVQRLRIHPDTFPPLDGDLPLDHWVPAARAADGALELELLPREATYLQVPAALTTNHDR